MISPHDEPLLKIPPNYPKYKPGSQLPHFPSLIVSPAPPTEAEEMLLTMVRPYMDDPETLFNVLEGLIEYFNDELT